MKIKKMIIAGALTGGFILGAAFGPSFGFAADDTTIQPYFNGKQFARGGMFMGQYFQGDMHAVIAEKLGMTADELFEARLEGKAIVDLLKAKDIDVDEVVNEIVAERQAQLIQMVKDKVITQYQMDYMLDMQKANIEAMIEVEGLGQGYFPGGAYMNPNADGNYSYPNPGIRGGMGRGMARGMGGCWMW
ncbi:hypothetical protein [Calidifontibacillus oryziterrae]|uniref:hypothetical protein n=1 Tax=Calidifontibacillus oryziterrae TaxID=1191699 RepID=UPI00031DF79A|nr:hypothetical protein [Calidifontibacillus oryziterrae]